MPASRAASVGAVERILYLRRLPLMAGLSARDLAAVADYAEERFFDRGGVLQREDEPIGALHFVVEGHVHVTSGGRLTGHARAGSAVGGLGLLAREPGLGAVAEEETLTLELAKEAVQELFDDHFSILHHTLRYCCRSLIEVHQKAPPEQIAEIPSFSALVPAGREMDLVERLFFLRQAPPLRTSSISALAALARGLTETCIQPGVSLWRPGDPQGWLALVVNGSLRCEVPGRPAFEAGPGTPLGALESLAERPRWYEARAASRVVALQGSVEGLLDVFEDHTSIALDYLATIARWLLRSIERQPGHPRELEAFYGCALEEAHGGPPVAGDG